MAASTATGEPAVRSGERGYSLAVLIGVLTVMGILIGAALPHWVAIAQREREEELISRGFQYAEAIRVFQKRQGRLPNRLQELIELEPRSIRQLWEDPMPEGGWLVLMDAPGGQVMAIDPETGEVVGGAGEGEEEGGEPSIPRRPGAQPRPLPRAEAGEGTGVSGPIHGVKSRARKEAYHVLFDQEDIGDWEFTVERLVAATSATGPDGLPRRAHYGILGRPFRYPPPGGVPGATQAPPAGRSPNGQPPPEPPPGEE